jgi:hypothetical protein
MEIFRIKKKLIPLWKKITYTKLEKGTFNNIYDKGLKM